MPKSLLYKPNARLLRCVYGLTESELIASWKTLQGSKESVFKLASLDPSYEQLKRYIPMLVYIPLSGAVIVALATFGIRRYFSAGPEIAIVGLALILGLLWHAFRGAAAFEFARFRYKNGELAFDIAKGEGQELAFSSFIEELAQRITQARRAH